MHSHLFELRLQDASPFSSYECRPEDRVLGPLSLINLFVGPNNSGKSRLLRYLFVNQGFDYSVLNFSNQTLRDLAAEIHEGFSGLFGPDIEQIGFTQRRCAR